MYWWRRAVIRSSPGGDVGELVISLGSACWCEKSALGCIRYHCIGLLQVVEKDPMVQTPTDIQRSGSFGS